MLCCIVLQSLYWTHLECSSNKYFLPVSTKVPGVIYSLYMSHNTGSSLNSLGELQHQQQKQLLSSKKNKENVLGHNSMNNDPLQWLGKHKMILVSFYTFDRRELSLYSLKCIVLDFNVLSSLYFLYQSIYPVANAYYSFTFKSKAFSRHFYPKQLTISTIVWRNRNSNISLAVQ